MNSHRTRKTTAVLLAALLCLVTGCGAGATIGSALGEVLGGALDGYPQEDYHYPPDPYYSDPYADGQRPYGRDIW